MDIATIPFVELVEGLIGVLFISTIVNAICKKINFPFTIALVLVGILLANFADFIPEHLRFYTQYELSPELILYVCLPTLVFQSATHLDVHSLKEDLFLILSFAIPGLLLSTAIIGTIVFLLTSLPLMPCLLLGSILSATDPVAVISIFTSLGAPKRLTTLVEGESLFNDATAVVTAHILFAFVLAGSYSTDLLATGAIDFCVKFFGGTLVGLVFGAITSMILGFVKSDSYIEISLSILLAYSSFFVSEEVFHFSGIMATLTCGLMIGSWGKTKISPDVTEFLHGYWDYMAYIANVIIFLLVGLNVNIPKLTVIAPTLLVVCLAMLISRAVVVFGIVPLGNKIQKSEKISFPYQTIMYWGGLRGAIALAIIISLGEFEYAELFTALCIGAVLFTLIVQGLSLESLVHYFELDKPSISDRLIAKEGILEAITKARASIPKLLKSNLFFKQIINDLKGDCEKRIKEVSREIDTIEETELNWDEEKRLLFLQCFSSQKALFFQLFQQGHFSEQTYYALSRMMKKQIDHLRHNNKPIPFEELQPTLPLIKALLTKFAESITIFPKFADTLRASRFSREYKILWGQRRAVLGMLEFFNQKSEKGVIDAPVLKSIDEYLNGWLTFTHDHLVNIEDQFPEFTTLMQKGIAERLLLQAEANGIREQIKQGTIPPAVGSSIETNLARKMHELNSRSPIQVKLDASELLSKVPFFKNIQKDEFKEIKKLLKLRIFSANEEIIKEGDKGSSMFLISRGIVRVCKIFEGKETVLATLSPGDFIGEMALIHPGPRTASCKAVSPAALYELNHKDFEKVCQKYPDIRQSIEEADKKRRSVLSSNK